MTTVPRPPTSPGEPQPPKRSLLGLLFKPQLGPTLSPIRESTRLFVQLVAGVFAIYKLIPKDYPGLRDPNARLSFSHIMATAWQNIRLSREGAPQAILFFAIIGVMAVSAIMAVLAVFSLFISHAHAQDTFTAPSTSDIAQGWMQYLFNTGGAYPSAGPITDGGSDNASTAMQNPFSTYGFLITGFQSALAAYSDAILIIAAIILFYHLTAMVVETAHHGVPMGKRASQIWAPIRLVVAIGLLVPINGTLNSGQYIVVQMAEWGSGLASNVWNGFLTEMAALNTQAVPPAAPAVQQVAVDMIRMLACQQSWNYHITEVADNNIPLTTMTTGSTTNAMLGSMSGTRISFDGGDLTDEAICGWYFIPDGSGNGLLEAAIKDQNSALQATQGVFNDAAKEMLNVVGTNSTAQQLALSTKFRDAVAAYQTSVMSAMNSLVNSDQAQISTALNSMKPYGWVMAGAFLNTIDRMESGLAAAAASSLPVTSPPRLGKLLDTTKPDTGVWAHLFGSGANDEWNIRYNTALDMQSYDLYEGKSVANSSSGTNAQCAAMVGLSTDSGDLASGAVNKIFAIVDYLANMNNAWSSGTGCGAAAGGAQTFSPIVQIGTQDPFAALSARGHANIETAFDLVSIVIATKAVVALSGVIPFVGAGIVTGIDSLVDSFQPIIYLVAGVLWTTGVTLSFLLPLMPFMRFSFAVLSWVAAVFEAVIAIPLVALAHLNPEGEGLPGQAKGAYFFIFNIFLRPVLTVFGLMCGLILFLVAVSFVNYAYDVAVAGAGGTAYGMAAVARLVYSILYVAILYVCANHTFALIDHIPQHALSWMGASGQAVPRMGDADKIESLGTAAGGYVGAKAAGAIGQGVSAGGKRFGAYSQKVGQAAGEAGESKPMIAQMTSQGRSAYEQGQAALYNKAESYAHDHGMSVEDFATNTAHEGQFQEVVGQENARDPHTFMKNYNKYKGFKD